jgi:conserved oligomeric Golgi complex subunit 3
MATALSQPPPSSGKPMMNVSYETFAPRSAAQINRLQRIAALTAGPTVVLEEKSNDPTWSLADCMSPLSSASHLSEKGSVQETLKRTLKATEQVTTLLKHTTSMRLALRASINIAEDISNRHAELLRHSGELSAAADRLQAEEAQLSRHAEEIGMPLQHYDAVDRIGVLVGVLFKGRTIVRGLAKIKVDNDEYPSILEEIDEAVEFFGNECGGKEALRIAERNRSSDGAQNMSGSMEYYRRSLALQEAALYLIREAVADRISQTTSDVTNHLNIAKIPIAADKLEASLVYTRFHGISARTNRLMLLVRNRLNRGEAYYDLFTLCRNTYCASRESLLKLTLRAHMDKLRDQHGLVGMTRLASVFLIRLCTVETSLYLDFFGDKKEESDDGKRASTSASTLASQVMSDEGTYYDSDFQTYLTNLCNALHRTVRRGLVTVLDLDTLCQIVSVLREERSMASSSPTTMAAARAISTVIEDAQERLIFCANSALSKEVVRFRSTPDDLDYPAKLVSKTVESATETGNDEDAVEKQLQVYESWFPPIRSVLRILSKIFRVVEARVFEDIARDSVQACTRCLKVGSSYILQRSGVIHADLFLVKHLLILREQLSPFDIELRSVERQLDFSDAGKAVSRFLANRNRRLFSMSTENALVTLLREGVSVQEANVDSKRDLEDALRSACNDFIEHTSQNIASDLINFGAQCKITGDNTSNQAFMQGDVVKSMLESTAMIVEVQLAEVTNQMSLYLDNGATQSILLKPVSRKIVRAIEDAKKYVLKTIDDENGWNPEERTSVLALMSEIETQVKQSTKTFGSAK